MPHYPVLQDNGLMAVWSTVVDAFTAVDCSDEECAAVIAQWHTGDTAEYVARTRRGELFEFQDNWGSRLGWMIFRHGFNDENVREVIMLSSENSLQQAMDTLRGILFDIHADEQTFRSARA